MGLGKTVQMLAFLQGQYRESVSEPALVICPASLVYNWIEECSRFTPDIPAVVLAGNLSQRKKEIRKIGTERGGWLYITSYDLLKRDIAFYEGMTFSTIVLDEAQFIKNRKTAVSKAVRVLKGSHRFALTGTPVENRLSELWSIFDFLMPGFLYKESEFSERFEVPIMKKEKIPFYTITGSTPKQERLRLVNAFNSGDTPVFLISLRAGGTGLNLTGADVVIHYDPWWNLAVQNQATDRAHRIGQTRQVTVIRLIASHSIEEKIQALQEAKRELADSIIGSEGGSIMNMSAAELLELLS